MTNCAVVQIESRVCSARRSTSRAALLYLGLAAALLPTAALAAPGADQPPENTLETVVVTARRVTEDVQKTPLAVSVYSGAQLQARGFTDVSDLTSDTPNLVIQSAGKTGAVSDAIYIRGLGQADSSPLSDPAVGVYVDGVYLARNVGNVVRLGDVRSVEVLRGPQGTLFGKNTIGGALNITLNKPGPDFDANAEATVGSFSQYSLKGMVNLPLSDKLFLRLSGLANTQDGYISMRYYPGHELGDDHTLVGRGQLLWEAAPNLSFTLGVDGSYTRNSGPATYLTAVYPNAAVPTIYNQMFSGNPACVTAAGQASNPICFGPVSLPVNPRITDTKLFDAAGRVIPPKNTDRQWGANLIGAWDVTEDVAVKSITSYRDQRSVAASNVGFTPYIFFVGAKTPDTSRQFSQEFQLSGKAADGRLQWVTGLYYFKEDIGSINAAITPLAATLPFNSYPVYSISYYNGVTTNYAAFGQATFSPTDRLHLTGGLRWTDEKKSINALVVPSTLPRLYGQLRTKKTTPLLSVLFDLSEQVHVYGSYSKGYRSGGFPARLAGNITSLPTFGPENATAYELGLKSQLFNNRVRANLALFRTNYDDIQASGTNTTLNLPTVINAGNARLKGAEAEVQAAVSDSFSLNTSLSWLDDKLTSINPTANDGGVPIKLTNHLTFAPHWKFALGGVYTYALAGGGDLIARVDANYTSRIWFSIGNQPHVQQGPVTLLNANLTYRLPTGKVEFVVGGKNLTNRRYFTNGFEDQRVNGVATNTLAEPRTAYATVRWRY